MKKSKTLEDIRLEIPLEIALAAMFDAYLRTKGLVSMDVDGQLHHIDSGVDPELKRMIKHVLASYGVDGRTREL